MERGRERERERVGEGETGRAGEKERGERGREESDRERGGWTERDGERGRERERGRDRGGSGRESDGIESQRCTYPLSICNSVSSLSSLWLPFWPWLPWWPWFILWTRFIWWTRMFWWPWMTWWPWLVLWPWLACDGFQLLRLLRPLLLASVVDGTNVWYLLCVIVDSVSPVCINPE